ncbi:MAG: glycoside hydrolase family 9 protein [Planctomycetota bacterium]
MPLVLAALIPATFALAAPRALAQTPHIRVDALGYEPMARKVAVLRRAVQGFDAPDAFTPGAAVEVVRVSDGAVVLSGPASPWNGGAVHPSSGDVAWTFDFTSLGPGEYRVRDAASGETSEAFVVAEDPFAGARRAAARVFFLQRSGFAKSPPYVDVRWSDGASHLGPEQDLDCRPVLDPSAPGRDLSGGWYDAGDYNKYVNFADDAVLLLLAAYEANPFVWSEDLGIPESGDDSPDLLDEVRWELEWLARMQLPGGSVLHKVSVTDFAAASPPSADTAPRRHAPATASATASATAAFARAAYVYGRAPGASNAAFAAEMEARAIDAWTWLAANPVFSSYDNAGFQNVAAENTPDQQGMQRVVAAAWLALLTGDPQFHAYVAAQYDAYPEYQLTSSGWTSPYQWDWTESLLRYAERATANPAVRADIEDRFVASMRGFWLPAALDGRDPYRAWLPDGDHVWGSNRTRASIGAMHAEAARLDPCNAGVFIEAARDHAHFFHGQSALGLTFLSGAETFGAENGVREIYHAWFADGTPWDRAVGGAPGPAPGFVTGGPNRTFAPSAAYTGPPLDPPMNQPPAKSYRDWNTSWPEESWEITEPSIGYQCAYVLLLSHLAPRGGADARTFCEASPNVAGRRGHVRIVGGTSLAATASALELSCAPPSAFAVLVAGRSYARTPSGNGWLCLASPLRLPGIVQADAAGALTEPLDLFAYPFSGIAGPMVGDSWGFQAWHRDGPSGWNFSDGVCVTWTP